MLHCFRFLQAVILSWKECPRESCSLQTSRGRLNTVNSVASFASETKDGKADAFLKRFHFFSIHDYNPPRGSITEEKSFQEIPVEEVCAGVVDTGQLPLSHPLSCNTQTSSPPPLLVFESRCDLKGRFL